MHQSNILYISKYSYSTIPKQEKEALNKLIQRIENKIDKLTETSSTKKENTKKKLKRNTKPLRKPITTQLFQLFMELPRKRKEKILQHHRFRMAITLLAATGCRINEIQKITKEQLEKASSTGEIILFQSKNNKYRTVIIGQQMMQYLKNMQHDINIIYQKNDYLAGNLTKNSWAYFINKRLKDSSKTLEIESDSLRSHSFRVNYVTELLKHKVPLQQVSRLIGHSDIQTTLKYDRYLPDRADITRLMDSVFPLSIQKINSEPVNKITSDN